VLVTDLLKVAQLTQAENDETTNPDLCSGNCSLYLRLYSRALYLRLC